MRHSLLWRRARLSHFVLIVSEPMSCADTMGQSARRPKVAKIICGPLLSLASGRWRQATLFQSEPFQRSSATDSAGSQHSRAVPRDWWMRKQRTSTGKPPSFRLKSKPIQSAPGLQSTSWLRSLPAPHCAVQVLNVSPSKALSGPMPATSERVPISRVPEAMTSAPSLGPGSFWEQASSEKSSISLTPQDLKEDCLGDPLHTSSLRAP
mmetsp:Transcript_46283/g.83384  ORF Transcript_46283/g.83384 Transcript_46283/m.83384 type:complete len:208 (-) Transcript_46283:3099-3722(-)